jgi:RNA polymerase sigma factor (sigma-70 family)
MKGRHPGANMTTASLSAVVHYVHRIEDDPGRNTDRQLLDRFALRQDESAFTELVRRHGGMVLGVCRRVLRHHQDTEDAFQAAFLVLARKAGSIRHESVGGWLYQVARRVSLRARARGEARRERLTALEEEVESHPGQANSLDGSVQEEVQRLPEQYRSAVVLCYLEGRTQAEAARMLATTASAVNSRLKRARDLLRRRLERRGLPLSGASLVGALADNAAPGPALVESTVRTALHFATGRAPALGASALAVALANGALHSMYTLKVKLFAAVVLVAAFVAGGAFLLSPPALGGDAAPPAIGPERRAGSVSDRRPAAKKPAGKAKAKVAPSVIILWMSGGPSQIDTFDPKPKHPNGALFPSIETNVKGVEISCNFPRLAKMMNHLAIVRTLKVREVDHIRATSLMRNGYGAGGLDYPELGSVLAKELGDGRPALPRYLRVSSPGGSFFLAPGGGAGFLGKQYGALEIEPRGGELKLPPAASFEALAKGRGEAHRKAVAKAFDLGEEPEAVRKAYGTGTFGKGCLLARRLVERGVPVVEVTLGGWDTHANALVPLVKLSTELDDAWSSLLKDLHKSKRLDSTLIVWMGEFGRTPRINPAKGRDHWPVSSVVLAGAGIKGGQVIGKTSADGSRIDARPVTVPEFFATIYQAVGVDPAKENRTPGGVKVRLVERGTKPVKEALR